MEPKTKPYFYSANSQYVDCDVYHFDLENSVLRRRKQVKDIDTQLVKWQDYIYLNKAYCLTGRS